MPPPPFTLLDYQQVIQRVYDQALNRLRVDTGATFTLGGELEVSISAADGDSIKINDGTNTLHINPDGSINVSLTGIYGTPSFIYNEVTSVGASSPTTVVSYTATSSSRLKYISGSGTNIGIYAVMVDSVTIAKRRTYFANGLNIDFDFGEGYLLNPGDTVILQATHNRPSLGDFNGRIQILE